MFRKCVDIGIDYGGSVVRGDHADGMRAHTQTRTDNMR